MKTKEFIKTVTVIRLLVGLKHADEDMQEEVKRNRYDWSLEDVPIEDVCEETLNRMLNVITELKRRIDAHKIHVKALEESQKIEAPIESIG